MRRWAPALALLLGVFAAGCAQSAFDRHLRAGRWTEAAAAFAADSTLQRDRRALRRVGMLHATPDSATWDPVRAHALLMLAVRRGGGASANEEAVLALLVAVLRDREVRQERERDLEERVAAASEAASEIREERDRLLAISTAWADERALLHRLIARLEADLRAREQELADLRLELGRLKAIDLSPPPARPPQ